MVFCIIIALRGVEINEIDLELNVSNLFNKERHVSPRRDVAILYIFTNAYSARSTEAACEKTNCSQFGASAASVSLAS